MHLDDLVERRSRLKNDLVIAPHFSTRYHSRKIKHLLQRAIRDMLEGRLHVWI